MDNIEAMKLLDGNDLQVNKDGDSWCVLFGSDLQSGISGWGDTATEALIDFSKNWEGASYENTKKAFDSLDAHDEQVEGEYRVESEGQVYHLLDDGSSRNFIGKCDTVSDARTFASLLNSQAKRIEKLERSITSISEKQAGTRLWLKERGYIDNGELLNFAIRRTITHLKRDKEALTVEIKDLKENRDLMNTDTEIGGGV